MHNLTHVYYNMNKHALNHINISFNTYAPSVRHNIIQYLWLNESVCVVRVHVSHHWNNIIIIILTSPISIPSWIPVMQLPGPIKRWQHRTDVAAKRSASFTSKLHKIVEITWTSTIKPSSITWIHWEVSGWMSWHRFNLCRVHVKKLQKFCFCQSTLSSAAWVPRKMDMATRQGSETSLPWKSGHWLHQTMAGDIVVAERDVELWLRNTENAFSIFNLSQVHQSNTWHEVYWSAKINHLLIAWEVTLVLAASMSEFDVILWSPCLS